MNWTKKGTVYHICMTLFVATASFTVYMNLVEHVQRYDQLNLRLGHIFLGLALAQRAKTRQGWFAWLIYACFFGIMLILKIKEMYF